LIFKAGVIDEWMESRYLETSKILMNDINLTFDFLALGTSALTGVSKFGKFLMISYPIFDDSSIKYSHGNPDNIPA
jgi:NADH:ubiquinone oxidoreductase subunit 5 (subunit L)/multisubunit Na+/H+ antiporter MnhA subunit